MHSSSGSSVCNSASRSLAVSSDVEWSDAEVYASSQSSGGRVGGTVGSATRCGGSGDRSRSHAVGGGGGVGGDLGVLGVLAELASLSVSLVSSLSDSELSEVP